MIFDDWVFVFFLGFVSLILGNGFSIWAILCFVILCGVYGAFKRFGD